MTELSTEDFKLLALARAAKSRAYAPHTGQAAGAAVRDTNGRTYAGGTVENVDPRLTTSALRAAVVAAASSEARSFEAAAFVGPGVPSEDDLAVLREFGEGVRVILANAFGVVGKEELTT